MKADHFSIIISMDMVEEMVTTELVVTNLVHINYLMTIYYHQEVIDRENIHGKAIFKRTENLYTITEDF